MFSLNTVYLLKLFLLMMVAMIAPGKRYKKFVPQILHLRDSGNKEEYSKEFKRLLQIEREKQKENENGREID